MTLYKPLAALTAQLSEALRLITNAHYNQPVPLVFNATVGQHVRHIIELFEELFRGYETGTVNYDNRRRDYVLESNKEIAIQRLNDINVLAVKSNTSLRLLGKYSADDEQTFEVVTNYYRELLYNLEHTIHHMALIRVAIANISGIELPKEFGVATATLKHQKACAQ